MENVGPTSRIPGMDIPARPEVYRGMRPVLKEPCATADILNVASTPPSSAEVKAALVIWGGMTEPCKKLIKVVLHGYTAHSDNETNADGRFGLYIRVNLDLCIKR